MQVRNVIQTLFRPHLTAHREVEEVVRSLSQLQERVIREMTAQAASEALYSALGVSFLRDFKRRVLAGPV